MIPALATSMSKGPSQHRQNALTDARSARSMGRHRHGQNSQERLTGFGATGGEQPHERARHQDDAPAHPPHPAGMERHHPRRSPRDASRALRGAGRAHAGHDRGGVRGRPVDVCGAERLGEPAGAVAGHQGCGAGAPGGRADGQHLRRPVRRRRPHRRTAASHPTRPPEHPAQRSGAALFAHPWKAWVTPGADTCHTPTTAPSPSPGSTPTHARPSRREGRGTEDTMEAIAGELLMALASGTAGAAGQQAWMSLRDLVRRPTAPDTGPEGPGESRQGRKNSLPSTKRPKARNARKRSPARWRCESHTTTPSGSTSRPGGAPRRTLWRAPVRATSTTASRAAARAPSSWGGTSTAPSHSTSHDAAPALSRCDILLRLHRPASMWSRAPGRPPDIGWGSRRAGMTGVYEVELSRRPQRRSG